MRRFLDMIDPVLRVRAPMPVDPPARPRPAGWWLVVGGLVLLMALVVIQTLRHGAHPSGYRGRHWEGPWPYPTEAIETWLSIMAAEGLALCLLLRGRGDAPLGVRALFLGILMLIVLLALSPLAMHAGTPIAEHFAWMGGASIWLVACAIAAGIAWRMYAEHPPRAEYVLTDKGRELGPVLKALRAWGERHTRR